MVINIGDKVGASCFLIDFFLPDGRYCVSGKKRRENDPYDLIARLDVLKLDASCVGRKYMTIGGWEAEVVRVDSEEVLVRHPEENYGCWFHSFDGVRRGQGAGDKYNLQCPAGNASSDLPRKADEVKPTQPGRELCSVCGTMCGAKVLGDACREWARLRAKWPGWTDGQVTAACKRNQAVPFKLSEPEPVRYTRREPEKPYVVQDGGWVCSDRKGESAKDFAIMPIEVLIADARARQRDADRRKRLARQEWVESLGRVK